MIHLLLIVFLLTLTVLAGRGALVICGLAQELDERARGGWGLAATAFTVGAAVLALLFAVIGHLSLSASTMTLPAMILATVGVFMTPWRRLDFSLPKSWPEGIALGALILFALINFLGTLSPEVRHDPLFYHVQIPQLWLNEGRMIEVPENGHSYFPYGYEMLYAWALSLGSDSAAKAFHWAAGLMAAYWAGRLTRVAGGREIYGASIFYSIPWMSYLSSSTYIDLATAMYGAAAVAILMESPPRDWPLRRAALYGFLVGSAMATKYTAWPLLGFPLLGVLIFVMSPRGWLIAGIAAATAVAPWSIRNLVYVGNPVAPLLISVFGPESATRTGLAGSFDSFAGDKSNPFAALWGLITYPQHLAGQKYMVSLLAIVIAPLLVQIRPARVRPWKRIWFLLIALFVCEAIFTRGHPDGRYGLTSMALGAALLGTLLTWNEKVRLRRPSLDPRGPFLPPVVIVILFVITIPDRQRHESQLGERWLPILAEQARLDYRIAKGLPPDFARVEELLLERGGRPIGWSYPSRTHYWIWIQGIRNEPLDTTPDPADPQSISEALKMLGFTTVINATNPGFPRQAWEQFLAEHTSSIPNAGPTEIRAIH